MAFPKTPKGLSSRITKIRAHLSAEKREWGCFDDSGGYRYDLFYLYFLLGDNRRSSAYLGWFKKSFPDDSGEPCALLCWALMLRRMGKNGDYILAKTMLSNIYLIPHVLGEDIARVDMSHLSNWREPSHLEYMPERVHAAITEDDLAWIRERFESEKFRAVLDRYIEINKELEHTPVGDSRNALVEEGSSLLDGWQ